MSYTVPKDFVGPVRVYLNCPIMKKDDKGEDHVDFPYQDATLKRSIPGALILVSDLDGEEFIMGQERVLRISKRKVPKEKKENALDNIVRFVHDGVTENKTETEKE